MDAGARRLALTALIASGDVAEPRRRVRARSDAVDDNRIPTPYLEPPEFTDVLVNGPDEIWVERAGHLERASERFSSAEALHRFVDRLLARVGERVDASKPLADARLPDGSRLH